VLFCECSFVLLVKFDELKLVFLGQGRNVDRLPARALRQGYQCVMMVVTHAFEMGLGRVKEPVWRWDILLDWVQVFGELLLNRVTDHLHRVVP
jgi:hypothetical protein